MTAQSTRTCSLSGRETERHLIYSPVEIQCGLGSQQETCITPPDTLLHYLLRVSHHMVSQ